MAQTYEPRKTVRVLASHANKNKEHPTVNIVTTAVDPAIHNYLQATGADPHNAYPIVIDSAGSVKGLPTIRIAGYTAPA